MPWYLHTCVILACAWRAWSARGRNCSGYSVAKTLDGAESSSNVNSPLTEPKRSPVGTFSLQDTAPHQLPASSSGSVQAAGLYWIAETRTVAIPTLPDAWRCRAVYCCSSSLCQPAGFEAVCDPPRSPAIVSTRARWFQKATVSGAYWLYLVKIPNALEGLAGSFQHFAHHQA